jgi:leucyl/phenylalanyl-tRNA---protein transferase
MIVRAYASGIFPMAANRFDPTIHWVAPEFRGILPLDALHVPRRLKRTVRQGRFEIRCDTDFEGVVRACAAPRKGRGETWINREIARVFCRLHRIGLTHSVEAWREDRLVGGLYGLALGGAFFGESMFSRETDSSKVALVYLVAALRLGGFGLLDIQFITDHLNRFGAVEIPADDYLVRLDAAMTLPAVFYSDFSAGAFVPAVEEVLTQSRTQTS